jgi:hypothetical protein
MAIAHRRVQIANPARRRRRNLSAKQIKFFGTPQQKAALKRSRAAKRERSNPRHRARKNIGEIVSLSLGAAANPARKKGTKMAKTHRRAKRVNRARSNAPRRRRRSTAVVHHRRRTRAVSNPPRRRNRRRNTVTHRRRHTYRRNPLGAGWMQTMTEGLAILSGLLGSKYVAQLVLSTSNTGIIGYVGNLAVGGIGGWALSSLAKKPKLGQNFFMGSVIEVIVRVLEDYTPAGSFISSIGIGDYFASNWVSPQRYTDALNSANVQIPGGWAPTTVIQSSAAPAGAVSQLSSMSPAMDGM